MPEEDGRKPAVPERPKEERGAAKAEEWPGAEGRREEDGGGRGGAEGPSEKTEGTKGAGAGADREERKGPGHEGTVDKDQETKVAAEEAETEGKQE